LHDANLKLKRKAAVDITHVSQILANHTTYRAPIHPFEWQL